jgi:8-oxo-dGTP pyrophosphatase MutT (NUDIX family)
LRLTAAEVRARLAGTTLPEDPSRVVLPAEFENWPVELQRQTNGEFKAAGVLIPIIDHHEELSVLLTRRAEHLRYHAGQVSFPGGRMEEGDSSIEVTALREAHEEVGISPGEVEIAGYLDPVLTITGYTVTPVVGLVASGVALAIDPGEVQHAFEVPLSFLLDDRNAHASTRMLHGVSVPILEYRFASERIWGATANIVKILRRTLLENTE